MSHKVLHKRSNQTQGGGAKLPSASTLDYGEVAINYHDGTEKLFIKNDNSEVVSFRSDNQLPPVEKHENQEFVYRQAVNENDAKSLIFDRIYGKTLAWNQQAKSIINAGDVYYFDNSSHQITINSIPSDFNNTEYKISDIVSSHKYYISLISDAPLVIYNYYSGIPVASADDAGRNRVIYSYYRSWVFDLGYSSAAQVGTYDAYVKIIDLTLMFGAGNEPSTVEEFEALFPEPYYPYNEGTLISNDCKSVETIGYNLWSGGSLDEFNGFYWKNDVGYDGIMSVLADVTQTSNEGFFRFVFHYTDGSISSSAVASGTTKIRIGGTSSSGKTVKSIDVDYNVGHATAEDICISFYDPSKSGIYEPYIKSTNILNLNDFYVKDPNGGADIHITGGLKSAGSVRDEIVGNKYIKRVGSVDLGTLNWSTLIDGYGKIFFKSSSVSDIINYSNSNVFKNFVTTLPYTTTSWDIINWTNNDSAKLITSYDKDIGVKDLSYSDGAAFRAAMSGVMLYYELATPIEYELVTPLNASVKAGTTERRISPDTEYGLSAPMVADISYTQGYEYILGEVSSQLGDVQSILQTI